MIGYNVSNGSCDICSTNCLACNFSSNGTQTCFACGLGYYVNNQSTCSGCGLLCLNCSNGTTCNQCLYSNMYYNATLSRCITCNSTCLTCNNGTSCQSCILNYYVEPLFGYGTCVSCLTEACLQCVNSSYCNICQQSFYNINGTCVSCNGLSPGCDACVYFINNKTTNCSSCMIGYFWNKTSARCVPCDLTICKDCVNATFCNSCREGYITETETGQCIPATPNCLYSKDSDPTQACTDCGSGYYLYEGQCRPCEVANCSVCKNVYNGTLSYCSACIIEHYLAN